MTRSTGSIRLAETIAYYNKEIAKIEAGGVENANDYRDARNLLLDELATYTNFNYQEDEKGSIQVYIENAIVCGCGSQLSSWL